MEDLQGARGAKSCSSCAGIVTEDSSTAARIIRKKGGNGRWAQQMPDTRRHPAERGATVSGRPGAEPGVLLVYLPEGEPKKK